MTNTEARIVHLEQQLRQLGVTLTTIQAQIAALQQAVRTAQSSSIYASSGGSGSSSDTGTPATTGFGSLSSGVPSIPAGGSASGVPVFDNNGNMINPAATIYNPFNVPTQGGLPLILAQNPDGSFTVVGESC